MADSDPPAVVLDRALGARRIDECRPLKSRESYGAVELHVEGRDRPLVCKYTAVAGWRLQKEAAVLGLLSGVESVPVPELCRVGTAGDDAEWTYLLSTKCDGTPASTVFDDDPGDHLDQIRAIGETLARLHEGTQFERSGSVVGDRDRCDDGDDPGAGTDNARPPTARLTESPRTWPGVLRELVVSEADILRGTAFEPFADRALELLAERSDALAVRGRPSLIHCDWNPENVFLSDAAVTCVIDWEYAKAGDPAYDLVAAEWRILGPGRESAGVRTALTGGYRAVRSTPPDLERRRRIYRALLSLDRMVALCGGSEATSVDPGIAETPDGRRVRQVARRAFEDLADG